MKKLLKNIRLFKALLYIYSFFAKRRFFNHTTRFLTTLAAKFSIIICHQDDIESLNLVKKWKALMPYSDEFIIIDNKAEKGVAEIRINCPLKNTGNIDACHRLMNYDRKLMEKFGGELTVLNSQVYPKNNYCTIQITKKAPRKLDA